MPPLLRSRLFVGLSGFVIALVLTLAAGAVVGRSTSAALADSERSRAAAESRADTAEERLQAEKAGSPESQTQTTPDARNGGAVQDGGSVPGGGAAAPVPAATSIPAETHSANPGFVVNVGVAAGQPALDAAEAAYVKISYFVGTKLRASDVPLSNGTVTIPFPADGVVTKICLKHTLRWKVDPAYNAEDIGTSRDRQGTIECLPAPATKPGQAVSVDFVVVPA